VSHPPLSKNMSHLIGTVFACLTERGQTSQKHAAVGERKNRRQPTGWPFVPHLLPKRAPAVTANAAAARAAVASRTSRAAAPRAACPVQTSKRRSSQHTFVVSLRSFACWTAAGSSAVVQIESQRHKSFAFLSRVYASQPSCTSQKKQHKSGFAACRTWPYGCG